MMQTIRSRFLTVICGVSLTLTLVFGSLCVFLVDRSETEIAAKTPHWPGHPRQYDTESDFHAVRRHRPLYRSHYRT